MPSIRFLDSGGAECEAWRPEGAGAQEAGDVAAARRAAGGGGGVLPRGGDGLVQREDGPRRDADRQRRGAGLQHHHAVGAEGGEAAGARTHTVTDTLSNLDRAVTTPPPVSTAVLGLHPGHADQPGQHDAGSHPLHAADVRGHGARRHGDGRQRAGGVLAEEGPGASTDGVRRRLQTPQVQLKGALQQDSRCCVHRPRQRGTNVFPSVGEVPE